MKGVDTTSKETIAMKIFKSNVFGIENCTNSHYAEVKFLQMMDHTNIIKLIDTVEDAHGLYLVFNFIDGTLNDEIYAEEYCYNKDRTKNVCEMILHAVDYIHNKGVIHRDLKPDMS